VEYLFQIGDNIFYPLHGAGCIQAIEEKEILGKKQQYYIIRMSINNMQVMIPTNNVDKFGIRPITNINTLPDIMHIYQHGASDESLSRDQSYKANLEKMKTGDIQETAAIMRDLLRMNEEKALNVNEKKMFDNAQKFLISELDLVDGITETQLKVFQ